MKTQIEVLYDDVYNFLEHLELYEDRRKSIVYLRNLNPYKYESRNSYLCRCRVNKKDINKMIFKKIKDITLPDKLKDNEILVCAEVSTKKKPKDFTYVGFVAIHTLNSVWHASINLTEADYHIFMSDSIVLLFKLDPYLLVDWTKGLFKGLENYYMREYNGQDVQHLFSNMIDQIARDHR